LIRRILGSILFFVLLELAAVVGLLVFGAWLLGAFG